MIFLMYVAAIHCLNYTGQESKKKKKKIAVYISDTLVTLKQSQGHTGVSEI